MRSEHSGAPQQEPTLPSPISKRAVWILALAGICLVVCCVAVVTFDRIKEAYPIKIVDANVPIDVTELPEHPTEQDWYPIAVQLLASNGWDLSQHPVTLISHFSCSSQLQLSRIHMEFADLDLVGVLPHAMLASVTLDRATHFASVWIEDLGPSLRPSQPLDLSKMSVRADQALELAEQYGGKDLRDRMGNECRVILFLKDYKWEIDYLGLKQPAQSELLIRVDAKTGRVRKLSEP